MNRYFYFSRITADHWTAKNNLEKAAHKLAYDMDRRLIQDKDLSAFMLEFKDKVSILNKEFSRCKPLRFSMERGKTHNEDYTVYCDGVFFMGIFLAKNTIT